MLSHSNISGLLLKIARCQVVKVNLATQILRTNITQTCINKYTFFYTEKNYKKLQIYKNWIFDHRKQKISKSQFYQEICTYVFYVYAVFKKHP